MAVERGGRMEEVERTRQEHADDADGGAVDEGAAWFRPRDRTDDPAPPVVCRFLAHATPDGSLAPPLAVPEPGHRCVALVDPAPQSTRQQELVCLTAAHANCPRFIRGVLVAGTPPVPVRREPVSGAVIGASLVLAASLAASFGFLAVRGGFDLDLSSPAPSALLAVASLAPSAPPPTPARPNMS
jgi:hypothetical protein